MTTNSQIRYLQRQEIDDEKWDRCVSDAPNGWIYARSYYLDQIGLWDALVQDDYELIMPLPKRKKYGLNYLYIPPFTGQLGVIGKIPITSGEINSFIHSIPKSFYVVDLLMNEENPGSTIGNAQRTRRTNYILSLKDPYSSIYGRYSKDARKNIRRAKGENLTITTSLSVQTVVDSYQRAYGSKNKHISHEDYEKLELLAAKCIQAGQGFLIGIQNENKSLFASAFFGLDEKRIYYILGSPSPEGRKTGAVHMLIDEVIKKYAGSGLVFDFEGSSIPSVAQFYAKFGSLSTQYDVIRISQFPRWVLRLKDRLK